MRLGKSRLVNAGLEGADATERIEIRKVSLSETLSGWLCEPRPN
jgi:hypothetical protein